MINVDAAKGFRRSHSAIRCPVCRYRPDDPYEHEDMLADLTVVWWIIAHVRIRRARYCYHARPHTPTCAALRYAGSQRPRRPPRSRPPPGGGAGGGPRGRAGRGGGRGGGGGGGGCGG